MKELILKAMEYEAEIRFYNGIIDQFDQLIIMELQKRADVIFYSISSNSIMACFSNRKSMQEFAGYVCKLC